jgi:hypothetical protein
MKRWPALCSLVALAAGCTGGDSARSTRSAADFTSFTDVTESSGVRFQHTSGFDGRSWRVAETVNGGVALLDCDGDGWLDIYFTNARKVDPGPSPPRNALYRNLGKGVFTDASAGSGADHPDFSLGCAVADVDGDGRSDIYVTNAGPNRLYRSLGGGRFEDLAPAARVAGESIDSGCAFFDMDADGDLDLYVASYVRAERDGLGPAMLRGVPSYWPPLNYEAAPDHLYENRGDGTFADVSEASGIRAVEPGRGLGVVASDLNGDGHLDLYVANDMTANFLFLGDGKGRFREDGFLAGNALGADGKELGSMGIAVGDYDLDGRSDLVVTNYQNQPNNLYRSAEGGLYEEMGTMAGIALHSLSLVSWGVGFSDLDKDGLEDLFIANGHLNPYTEKMDETTRHEQPNLVYRNRGDGAFEDLSGAAGRALAAARSSRGAAFGDLDNDGDVDIVVVSADGPPQILRNDSRAARSWALVRLVGGGRNRDAIGTRVSLVADGRTQWRERRSAESYLSANDPRLHFGLGGAERITSLEVRWPSGEVERHEDLPARRLITIEKGEKAFAATEP